MCRIIFPREVERNVWLQDFRYTTAGPRNYVEASATAGPDCHSEKKIIVKAGTVLFSFFFYPFFAECVFLLKVNFSQILPLTPDRENLLKALGGRVRLCSLQVTLDYPVP